jgi:hypothetical protein
MRTHTAINLWKKFVTSRTELSPAVIVTVIDMLSIQRRKAERDFNNF